MYDIGDEVASQQFEDDLANGLLMEEESPPPSKVSSFFWALFGPEIPEEMNDRKRYSSISPGRLLYNKTIQIRKAK